MAEIPQNQRAIIIQYRFVDSLSFREISSRVQGVTAAGAKKLCQRTQKRANSNKITKLLTNSSVLPRTGAPRRVEPGSRHSKRIRNAVRTRYKFHSQEDAANEANSRVRNINRKPLTQLNVKQVHNITQTEAHGRHQYGKDGLDARPITRKRALEKPRLNKLDLDHRKRYIEQILALDEDNTILIGCDETPIEFGGTGHTHISAPKGITVYADEASDPRFSKMQWDAASNDLRVTRPCIVWNKEDKQEAEVLTQKLTHQVGLLQAKVNYNRAEASKPRTTQYKLLHDINDDIKAYNASLPPKQRTGRKQVMTIKRLFKYDKLTRDHKKGGLDFVWYAFRVYEEQLFPYYRTLQGLNPGKDVFIIEDNVGVHHKARRLLTDQIYEFNIKFLDTPANSPDLHPIESLHKDQKREIADFRFKVISTTAAVQARAENEMIRIWQRSPIFDAEVQKKFAISYFKGLAQRSKDSEPAYGNRYKDSI
jgi:hypothetical protein